MKIIRKGNEYELSFYELMEANREYEEKCIIEDIVCRYNVDEITDDKLKEIAMEIKNALDCCDSFFESYWSMVDYVCKEEFNLTEV